MCCMTAFGVAVGVHEDLGVGDHAGDAIALGVDHDGGDAEDVAAVAGVVSTLWMEWQTMQVTPSRSKLRSPVAAGLRLPERTAMGLWQLSQWRVNSMPFSWRRRLTLVR